jgi:hypothetical protein
MLRNIMQGVRTLMNRFHKRQGMSSLLELLPASQEELCFMELDKKYVQNFSLKTSREENIWDTKV